jgi:hypothetical protein
LGKDELNMVKIVSAVLLFSGVYLVTAPNNALKLNQKRKQQTKKGPPSFSYL